MMCESANDVTEMSERVPVGVPRSVEPSASHESSITWRPWVSAMARIGAVSIVTSAFDRRERLRGLGVEHHVQLRDPEPTALFAYCAGHDAAGDAGRHLVDHVGHVDVRREGGAVALLFDDVDVR